MSDRAGLRLRAESAEDVETLSAALQDSVFKVGDAHYDAAARRFTAIVNRFVWEAAGRKGPYQRVRAALSVDGVTGARSLRVRRTDKDAIVSLLALTFVPEDEPPAGAMRFVLSGGGEIHLAVECVDALLLDIGPPWPTEHKPFHGIR